MRFVIAEAVGNEWKRIQNLPVFHTWQSAERYYNEVLIGECRIETELGTPVKYLNKTINVLNK